MLDTTRTLGSPTRPRNSARAPGAAETVLIAAFSAYLALLTWAIVWKLRLPHMGDTFSPVKWVPFAPTTVFGPSAPYEVAANFLAFVPLGLLLGALRPRRALWVRVLLIAAISVTYETLQFVFAVGAADVTDVLVNTAGGAVGLALLACARTHSKFGSRAVLQRASGFALLVTLVGSAFAVVSLAQ
ncbi:VanZ family protein [Leucobacter aridicollis]|uniref:VanZ family protein n=1 Tax=Leucobacter aridicollis TaxID=283878 RepID=UPI0021034627|nr:VanZ family protein [Leucobacter aridicollis]UTX53210.1 VanZ family protein [Leucobacter aridicollis]